MDERGGGPRRRSWLERFEQRMLTVLGPARVDPVGEQPARSRTRTDGVGSGWVVVRDASGTPYLRARRRDEDGAGADGADGAHRPGELGGR